MRKTLDRLLALLLSVLMLCGGMTAALAADGDAPETYILTFDVRGGTWDAVKWNSDGTEATAYQSTDAKYVSPNSTYGAADKNNKKWPKDPSREGYTFMGWMNGTAMVSADDNVTITQDTIFYALWKYNEPQVSFNVNHDFRPVNMFAFNAGSGALSSNSGESGGITYSYDPATGIITLDGTATQSTYFSINSIATEDGDYILSMTKVGGSASFSPSNSCLVLEPQLNGSRLSGRRYFDSKMTANVTYTKVITYSEFGEANELKFWIWCVASSGGSATFSNAQYKLAMYKASEAVSNELPAGRYVSSDDSYGALPDVTREGYTFAGWHVGSEDGPLVTEESKIASIDDHTLYAAWTPESYEVTFALDGGSLTEGGGFAADMDNQTKTVTYADAFGAESDGKTWPNDPTKEGYTFAGWTDSKTIITADDTVSITADTTLTAAWTINSYYLDLNGKLDGIAIGNIKGYGTADLCVDDVVIGNNLSDYYHKTNYGAKYDFNDIQAVRGHRYLGVSDGQLSGQMPASKYAVVLEYATNAYTIVYSANGGDGTAPESNTGVYYDDLRNMGFTTSFVVAENTFNRTGYTFVGWNTKANGSGEDIAPGGTVSAKTLVDLCESDPGDSGTVYLYAKWKAQDYTVKWSVDGKTTTHTVTFGDTIPMPAAPQKDGFTFTGWTPAIPVSMPANDLTFTAQFKPNTYIATLVADGEIVKEIEYSTGQKSISLPDVPAKEGFTGVWPSYTLPIGGVTITAVYTKNDYTVTWDVDGVLTTDTVPYGDSIPTPDAPQKDGCLFNGWSPAVPETMPAHDLMFTAQFEPIVATSLRVVQKPTKVLYIYRIHKDLDLSGLVLEATYSDGTVKTITDFSDCTISGYSAKPAGEKTITVEYEGVKTEFNVTVYYAWWQFIILFGLFGWLWYV